MIFFGNLSAPHLKSREVSPDVAIRRHIRTEADSEKYNIAALKMKKEGLECDKTLN
jgi:hypothetical protein